MEQLQDALYSVKETCYEVWDGIQERFPFLSEIPQHKILIISGAAVLLSLVCVLKTLGNTQTAASLQAAAVNYRAGQEQLNAVLGDSVEIGLDEDAEEIMGITNLTLQYKSLTSLPSDSGITSMQKALGIGDSQTSSENADYNAEMSSKIKDFAGNYGGALVVPGTIGTSSLKVAAYNATSNMRVPDDSSVSNVLYEKIRRTIESDEYGVADTQNELIFLSAANIKGISSVKVGSSLYTLFGDEDSSGSKEMNRYICTGVATGTYVTDEDEEEEEETSVSDSTGTEDADTSESSDTESTEEAVSYSYDVDEEAASEDDSVPVVETDASRVVITSEDVVDGDASYNSDGTVNKTWSEENEDAETVSSASTEDEDSDESDSEKSSNGFTNDGLPTTSKYSVVSAQVLDENGNQITDNKTADLILYQYSRRTGKVKITYWNVAGSEAATKALAGQTTTSTESGTTTVEEN